MPSLQMLLHVGDTDHLEVDTFQMALRILSEVRASESLDAVVGALITIFIQVVKIIAESRCTSPFAGGCTAGWKLRALLLFFFWKLIARYVRGKSESIQ